VKFCEALGIPEEDFFDDRDELVSYVGNIVSRMEAWVKAKGEYEVMQDELQHIDDSLNLAERLQAASKKIQEDLGRLKLLEAAEMAAHETAKKVAERREALVAMERGAEKFEALKVGIRNRLRVRLGGHHGHYRQCGYIGVHCVEKGLDSAS